MTTEERLAKVERELGRAKRRIIWLPLAVMGLAAGVWLWAGAFEGRMASAQVGGAAVKEVCANRFVLEDENGKVHAALIVGKAGPGPVLSLYDAVGEPRAMLSVGKDGPVLSLYDAAGKERAALGVNKDGSGLSLIDENGKVRIGLGVFADRPVLLLYDEAGKPIWSAP